MTEIEHKYDKDYEWVIREIIGKEREFFLEKRNSRSNRQKAIRKVIERDSIVEKFLDDS